MRCRHWNLLHRLNRVVYAHRNDKYNCGRAQHVTCVGGEIHLGSPALAHTCRSIPCMSVACPVCTYFVTIHLHSIKILCQNKYYYHCDLFIISPPPPGAVGIDVQHPRRLPPRRPRCGGRHLRGGSRRCWRPRQPLLPHERIARPDDLRGGSEGRGPAHRGRAARHRRRRTGEETSLDVVFGRRLRTSSSHVVFARRLRTSTSDIVFGRRLLTSSSDVVFGRRLRTSSSDVVFGRRFRTSSSDVVIVRRSALPRTNQQKRVNYRVMISPVRHIKFVFYV